MDFDMSCPAQTFSGQSLLSIGSQNSFNLASSILLGILGKDVEGFFFSNLSLGSSPAWYFHLTPFETLFCGLLILQIFVLRYLQILPINFNNFLVGDPTGRKKRSTLKNSKIYGYSNTDHLAEATFSLLRRLDEQDCLLKSLCILESQFVRGKSVPKVPKETRDMISALAMSGQRRKKLELTTSGGTKIRGKTSAMNSFEDAVLIGSKLSGLNKSVNGTMDLCGPQFKACFEHSNDIIKYIDIISEAGML